MRTHKKRDFTPVKPPVGFVTDAGVWIDAELRKSNIKSYWFRLKDGKLERTIKVKRNSSKLKYEKKGD